MASLVRQLDDATRARAVFEAHFTASGRKLAETTAELQARVDWGRDFGAGRTLSPPPLLLQTTTAALTAAQADIAATTASLAGAQSELGSVRAELEAALGRLEATTALLAAEQVCVAHIGGAPQKVCC